MDVIHFPDDPRPARWTQPVLALGNFDGVHRGHRKILERVRRVAGERGATAVVMTFDPHPPRVVRPDKAPPLLMTTAQRLEAIAASGVQGAAIVRFTPELSRWDPETFVRTVLVDWLRVGGSVGRRELPVRPRSRGQLLAAADARRRATASRPRRSIRSATRTSSSAARASGGWSARDASTKRARCSGTSITSTASVVARRSARPRRSAFRPRISAPRTSSCRRTASTRRPPRLTAWCGRRSPTSACRPTVDASGRATIETHVFDFDENLYGAPLRIGFVQRLRDERAFESLDAPARADRRRLRSGARALRSPFTVEFRARGPLTISSSRWTFPARASREMLLELVARVLARGRRARRDGVAGAGRRARTPRWPRGPRDQPVRRSASRRGGQLDIVVSSQRGRDLADLARHPLADPQRCASTTP